MKALQRNQFLRLWRFHTTSLMKDYAFWLVIAGIITSLLIAVLSSKGSYEARHLPSAVVILRSLSRFDNLIIAAMLVFGADLYWKESQYRIHPILHAYPISTGLLVSSKYAALAFTGLVVVSITGIVAILIQVWSGYFQFDLHVFFTYLIGRLWKEMLFFLAISFVFQALFQNKFVGIAFSLLIVFGQPLLISLGWEHPLFYPTSIGFGLYTDISGFGPYLERFGWFSAYVFSWTSAFLLAAILTFSRGAESHWKQQLLQLVKFPNGRFRLWLVANTVLTIGTGTFIFWNTNVLNDYKNSKSTDRLKVAYERELGYIKNESQPQISCVKLKVDLYPSSSSYSVRGSYWLKNESADSIRQLYVQKRMNASSLGLSGDAANASVIQVGEIAFNVAAQMTADFPEFSHAIYKLEDVMAPGDSIQMDFAVNYKRRGFTAKSINSEVLKNGTFFNIEHFPFLGYNDGFELTSARKRQRFSLAPKLRMKERDDKEAASQGVNGAHSITLDVTISTEKGQTAIAPGYLVNRWDEGDRSYFHYKLDDPIENQYALQSARYAILQDSIELENRPIQLEIYHHPSHDYNTARMMQGMKASLTYFSEKFSPYQYEQARIIEFPGYQSYAVSYPNTIPFSERIGFLMDIREGDPDIPFWITAHEVAHQWWGDQVRAAPVKGAGFITESLAQYSAAMVFRNERGEEALTPIRDHERKRYLEGRQNEVFSENPLAFVEDQAYIHYGKGLTNLYALQHYISEDSVSKALQRLTQDYPGKDRKYVTSDVLINYLRKSTPDSLQNFVTDLFERIVFFDNRIRTASIQEESNGEFLVTLETETIKFEADSLGTVTDISVNDWIEIALYDEQEEEIYRAMHFFDTNNSEVKIRVASRPLAVMIDPMKVLMDREFVDNYREF